MMTISNYEQSIDSKFREIMEMVGSSGSEENILKRKMTKKIEGGKNSLHKMITMRQLADNIAQVSQTISQQSKFRTHSKKCRTRILGNKHDDQQVALHFRQISPHMARNVHLNVFRRS